MWDNYPVKKRSNSEVREIAKQARESFAIKSDDQRIDLIATLRQSTIATCYGTKHLTFSQYESADGLDEGKTEFFPNHVNISLNSRVYERLRYGDGRARNTASHEIGHAIMHEGPTLFRKANALQNRWVEPFRSAEHQTKVFAPAFLIDDIVALKLTSAQEISIIFGVSFESADIYLRELQRPDERRAVAKKLIQLGRELHTSNQPAHVLKFLAEPCTRCGQSKLFPVGSKYMCQECDQVFDRFQDGDTLE